MIRWPNPPGRIERHLPDIRQARLAINEALYQHCMSAPRTRLLDLSTLMPQSPEGESSSWWEWDGVHMTATGYEHLSGLLEPVVVDCIQKEVCDDIGKDG